MVYGAEAIPLSDISHGSPRGTACVKEEAESARHDDLGILKEVRVLALSRSAIYQQNLHHCHSCQVRGRIFHVGDLVLHRIQNTKDMHKLSAPWEGPFIIQEVLMSGAYRLKNPKTGKIMENSWNIAQLCHFYT